MKRLTIYNSWCGRSAAALAVFLMAISGQAQTLTIATAAGYAGNGSANGTGSGALFNGAQGVAVDGAGNVYVADTGNNIIRVINALGVSSTLAGTAGVTGSANGTGAAASFNQPTGLALDSATNLYVTDYGNHIIRKITPTGVVTTFAGTAGISGSGNGTSVAAQFFHPMGLAVDATNNLYVADYGNDLIRKITPGAMVTTLAGTAGVFGSGNGTGASVQFYNPEGVAVDGAGNVYVADTGNGAIREITPGGTVSTLAGSPGSLGSTDATGTNALFYQPVGLALDSSTNLYVSDYFSDTIRQISPAGVVVTLAGLAGMAGSADGANSSARFWGPQGLAVSLAGSIYVADSGNGTIRVLTSAGVVTTLAGSASIGSVNGTGAIARFYRPQTVAADGSGNIYVADTQNSVIRKITSAGTVSTLAGSAGVIGSLDGNGTTALFAGPQGVATDAAGNIYVADTGNSTIRKITSSGTVSTLAGMAGLPGNTDGSGTNAQFSEPEGLALDAANNIYVADTWNHTLRKITSGGVVSTLAGLSGTFGSFDGTNSAARFNFPTGVTVDSSGNIYVTDYNNNTVREVTPAGVVTTLAGWAGMWGSSNGVGGTALFLQPAGITTDGSGNLYVTDSGNDTLRKLTPSGTNWAVTTAAGVADVSGSNDGSPAEFSDPSGVTFSGGYIYIADSGNNTIRSQAIPPSILFQPQSQTILTGTTTTFTVGVAGSSPLTYLWQYNGSPLTITGNGVLTVSNVGTYQVTITNIIGSVTSSTATLTLTNAPALPGSFQSLSVSNGLVQLNFTGTVGGLYTLQVSSNLTSWSALSTFTLTNGTLSYLDASASNAPVRFYRLVSP